MSLSAKCKNPYLNFSYPRMSALTMTVQVREVAELTWVSAARDYWMSIYYPFDQPRPKYCYIFPSDCSADILT